MKRNPNCDLCVLGKTCHTRCVWGVGNSKAKVLLCGEAPGYEEDREGVPFVGQAGALLDHVCNKLGVDRLVSCYTTNVLKCRPSDNKLPGKKELRVCWASCKRYLNQELYNLSNIQVIVLMGGTALTLYHGTTGITKNEGMVLAGNIPVVAAFHPAYVLRAPGKEVRLGQALARAFSLAGIKISPRGMEGGMFPYEVRS